MEDLKIQPSEFWDMTPQEFWMLINHRIKKAAPKAQPMTRDRMMQMIMADRAGKLTKAEARLRREMAGTP